jgi:DNA invertase Pin-like site-specific DNA recombinase
MKTAYLYIRVSTDEQADKGYSQRSQDEMLRRYCELNKITVKAAFFEDHSAKTFNRPEFTKMLLNIRKHKGIVDLVLFTKWDRFSRNAGDAYGMISTLNKLGVEPQAVEQPLNLEIPENKMMLAFYLAAPEVENDRRALNTFMGMRRAKKEGRWMGAAPMGYVNKVAENGKKYIAPHPEEAPIVKWFFQEVASGNFTVESLFKRAQEKGLNYKKHAFWLAIRNPVYCGKIFVPAYKSEEEQLVTGQHQPLISEALFYQVQDILDGKKKVQRTKVDVDDRFPLRGYLLCPDCGRLLTASASKGRHQYYSYYHCTGSCKVRFKSETVNEEFVSELAKWKPHPAVMVLYKMVVKDVYEQKNGTERKDLLSIRNEIERLTRRKKTALDMRMSGDLDNDDYRLIKKECEEGIVQLEDKLSKLALSQTNIESQIEQVTEVLSNLDVHYTQSNTLIKRELVGSIYPEKLQFDGNGFRTARVNEVVRIIYSLDAAFGAIKKEQAIDYSSLFLQVTL